MELLKYFGSESEMLSHGSRLMVAPEHDHLSRVVQFKAEQKHAHLQRKNSPVNVVAQEKEICPTMKVKHKIDIQTQERHKSQVRVSNQKSAFCHLRWDAFRVDNFLKHVDHVIELSVDVSNDNDRLLDSNHVGLVAWKQIRWLIYQHQHVAMKK